MMAAHSTDLHRRAWRGLLQFLALLAVLLFVPAWSLHFWQAWIYWLVFGVATISNNAYFLKRDPKLVERRLSAGPAAEREMTQKIIMTVIFAGFLLLVVVPGFDHRSNWSSVPPWLVLGADAGFALGFAIVFYVLKENSYAAATIRVEFEQTVISTGPYRIVRHPMYAGALPMFGFTPLALGSYWTLLVLVPMAPVLAWRLLDEERFLTLNLPGYADYCRRVRYRLIPGVW